MKLRGRFSLLASIGLSFGIGLTGCSSESQNQVLPAGSTVIALGDSLMAMALVQRQLTLACLLT